ncbi:MAG: Maf family nucleotide pyrophosphatase [Neisseriaceae bacterium]
MKIILASSSLSRKWQLQQIGLDFIARAPNIDERRLPQELACEMAARLSKEKAKAVQGDYSNALIIASDQVIVCEHLILGKPLLRERGLAVLKKINGKHLKIFSGAYFLNTQTGRSYQHVEETWVRLRKLKPEQLEVYLDKEPEALYCAGGIKSEGLGMLLVKEMHASDPTAVLGLPMYFVIEVLMKEGIHLL